MSVTIERREVKLVGRGLRGVSWAQAARTEGAYGATSASTDAQVLDLLKDDIEAYIQGVTNFRGTIAEGVAAFAVGQYFTSAETGSLRMYKRTGTTPFYVDQGDAAAPMTKALLAGPTGATFVGFKRSESGAVQRLASDKFREAPTWYDFGAIGDGTVHTVAEWIIPGALGRFASLAALQVQYPHVASTSDTIDWAAAQAAVDAAIYGGSSGNLGHKAVVRPGVGDFVINRGINLGYGTGLTQIIVEGAGMRAYGETAFVGTVIRLTANVGMAFAIQGGRYVEIRNLSIQGQNRTHLESNFYGAAAGPQTDLVASNWVNSAFPAASSARYTPYAGIAIDPYCGTAPATPYPAVTYPAFLGTVSQYGKNPTSAVVIEDVNIEGFAVAVASKPCNADGNAEDVKLIRVAIRFCQYAVSIGHTQSRVLSVIDSTIVNVHTAFVTTKHGLQNGKPSITVIGTEIGQVIKWVDMPSMPLGGPPIFIGCYGELVYQIGNSGTGAAGNSVITFKSCEIQFNLQQYRGTPKYVFEDNGGNGIIRFEGCRFAAAGAGFYGFYSNSNTARPYSFVGCSIAPPPVAETARYRMFAHNASGSVFVNQMQVNFTEFDVSTFGYNLDTGAGIANYRITRANTGARPFCLPGVTELARASAAKDDPGVNVRLSGNFATKSGTPTVSGRIATVDTGLTGSEWAIAQRGFGVGCMVFDEQTGIAFVVKARTGGVLTLEAVSGFDNSGNLLTTMTSSGTLYTLNALRYTPTLPLFVDVPSVTATATNASDGTGSATFITADIVVNDYVRFVANGQDWFGSENRLQITARDATARTITVNGEWQGVRTFRRVPVLLRAEAPSG